MNIGELVKNYRDEHKLSMDEFAKKSSLSKGYISMLEKNEHPKTKKPITPSLETIKSIAKAINMEFNALIGALDKNQKVLLLQETDIVTPTANNITEKVKKLSVDKQKKVEKIVDDLSGSETIAAHRTDDPTKDLPEEARQSIEDFKKFIFEKHGIKYD